MYSVNDDADNFATTSLSSSGPRNPDPWAWVWTGLRAAAAGQAAANGSGIVPIAYDTLGAANRRYAIFMVGTNHVRTRAYSWCVYRHRRNQRGTTSCSRR